MVKPGLRVSTSRSRGNELMPVVRCQNCQLPYPERGVPYLCPACGGIFDFDGPFDFSLEIDDPNQPGMWRYRDAFALPESAREVSLGEGNTPLVWAEIEGIRAALKLESANPTGSYKDRGTAVLMSHLLNRGIKAAVEDSSGNAGASFAAYAARAGIKGRVFVPESASGPKRVQIEQLGAELVSIPGPRSEAARAVLQEVEQGAVYASHAYLPFGLAGIATIAYEIWQQLGCSPGSVVAPVGHGGLLLGIMRGFSALHNAGLIDKTPYYIGVQAQACAPAVSLYMQQFGMDIPVLEDTTLAEGVRVRNPVRAAAIVSEMGIAGGEFIGIPEENILTGFKQAARQGFYIEPTSALPWAALSMLKKELPEPVVIILTGTGLKYNPYS